MPERFEQAFDNFGGQDMRLDPAQARELSPWMVNFEPTKKGTALKTRSGSRYLCSVSRHLVSGVYHPALVAVDLKRLGFAGNYYFLVSGTSVNRVICAAQHVMPDGEDPADALTDGIKQIFPAFGADATHWPRGMDRGDYEREQIDWFGSMFSAHGRLFVFQQHQVPIHVRGSVAKPLGLDRPTRRPTCAPAAVLSMVSGTVTSGDADELIDSTISSEIADDFYNGAVVAVTSKGIWALITDYTQSTRKISVAAWDGKAATVPAASDTYRIFDVADCITGVAEGGATQSMTLPATPAWGTLPTELNALAAWSVLTDKGDYRTIDGYDPEQRKIHVTADWTTDQTPTSTTKFILINEATGAGLQGDYRYKLTLIDKDLEFFCESPPSYDTLTISASDKKVLVTLANVDADLHPSAVATHVRIYRKKVSDTETWQNYVMVAEVPLATFKASGFVDSMSDAAIETRNQILNERSLNFRGFGVAAYHGGRIYAGNQADWSGVIDIDAGAEYGILSPTLALAASSGDTYLNYWLDGREFIWIAGVRYPLAFLRRESNLNRAYLSNEDRTGTAPYHGASSDEATCRIPGDKRTIYISYAGPAGVSTRQFDYQVRPGADTDGELTGLAAMRGDMLACYQRALILLYGGDFADNLTNGDSAPNWGWRYISDKVGLIAPKSLAFDEDGFAYGFGGPNGGVWRCSGLQVETISDPTLRERLNSFHNHAFCTGKYDVQQRRYTLTFPLSLDHHGFVFDFELGQWWEVAGVPPVTSAAPTGAIGGVAMAALPDEDDVVEGEDEPPIIDVPDDPIDDDDDGEEDNPPSDEPNEESDVWFIGPEVLSADFSHEQNLPRFHFRQPTELYGATEVDGDPLELNLRILDQNAIDDYFEHHGNRPPNDELLQLWWRDYNHVGSWQGTRKRNNRLLQIFNSWHLNGYVAHFCFPFRSFWYRGCVLKVNTCTIADHFGDVLTFDQAPLADYVEGGYLAPGDPTQVFHDAPNPILYNHAHNLGEHIGTSANGVMNGSPLCESYNWEFAISKADKTLECTITGAVAFSAVSEDGYIVASIPVSDPASFFDDLPDDPLNWIIMVMDAPNAPSFPEKYQYGPNNRGEVNFVGFIPNRPIIGTRGKIIGYDSDTGNVLVRFKATGYEAYFDTVPELMSEAQRSVVRYEHQQRLDRYYWHGAIPDYWVGGSNYTDWQWIFQPDETWLPSLSFDATGDRWTIDYTGATVRIFRNAF